MYISTQSILGSFERLIEHEIKTSFWGLLFILKSAKGKISNVNLQTNSLINFDGGEVSNNLNKIFSVKSNDTPTKFMKIILSNDYVFQTFKKFLHKKKVSLIDAATILMYDCDFSQQSNDHIKERFIKVFKLSDEELQTWFNETNENQVDFVESVINDPQKLFKIPLEKQAIAISKDKYMVAKAGEWGRSGYVQTFNNTSASKEFAQVIADDLVSSVVDVREALSSASKDRGRNKIIFGAPGVGKSHAADNMVKGSKFIRTVFHPGTSSAEFIGTMLPSINLDPHGNKQVTYDYSPGAFLQALKIAEDSLKDKSHAFLIIEELNRAQAEGVFAEVFQLLDRDSMGISKFPVSLDINATSYLTEFAPGSLIDDRVIIPANLSIISTMNYSDQNVFKLDNAFKRRWELEFIPIDFNFCPEFSLEISDKDGIKKSVEWAKLAETINEVLELNGFQDDQKVGQYFISEQEFIIFGQKIIIDKLYSYLWEEVLDNSSRDLVFHPSLLSFQKLHAAAIAGKEIFSGAFLEKLLGSDV